MQKKETITVKELKDYFTNEILIAESGLAFWNRKANKEEKNSMLKHWQTVKDVLVKCRKDLLGADSVIPEIATSKKRESIVIHTDFKDGTTEHLKHYETEYERVKELADNATGELANTLYFELDSIIMILESYKP
ncbi:MAG: hypothetical protein V3U92_03415 [Cellulophaga sp.]